MIVNILCGSMSGPQLYSHLFKTPGVSRKKLKQRGQKLAQDFGRGPYYLVDSLKELHGLLSSLEHTGRYRATLVASKTKGQFNLTLTDTTL